MDQSRRQYRADRGAAGRSSARQAAVVRTDTARHRATPAPGLRTRRVAAAVVIALAAASAAIGAARGQDQGIRASGTLLKTPSAPTAPTPAGTPTPTAPTPSTKASTSTAASSSTSRPTASATSAGATASRPPAVPTRGNGKLVRVLVPGRDSTGGGRVVTYAFEIEDGLRIDRGAAAELVGDTLRDPRGWQRVKGVRFVQVTPAQRAEGVRPAVTISLVSPGKTDDMCAPLGTNGTWSCANKDHAVINFRRWASSVPGYAGKSLRDYRSYVVNHEVGHELGLSHVKCSGPGKIAAVMMQQSKGLQGCKPNVWPATTRG